MSILRSVRLDELDQLWDLIGQASHGLTTLKINQQQLLERVELSDFAFRRSTEKPSGEPYVFVLEDPATGKLVGTSCIFSKIGGYEPFYAYQLVTDRRHSDVLGVTRQVTALHLRKIHDGPTEIGSLFLLPQFRGQGRGRLLSLGRFAFMACHPQRFSDEVIAEIRGVINDQGECPFWEAIGRHFFDIDFPEANSLSTISKRFIEDLMPQYPIYLDLLSPQVREVIGQVHPDSRPARSMLEAEGFAYHDMIDIFDGGPALHCRRADIDAIRRCRPATLRALTETVDGPNMICVRQQPGFRAVVTPVRREGDGIAVSSLAGLMLNARLGDPLWTMPLRPEPPVTDASG